MDASADAALSGISERLKENLSSVQIARTLDALIFQNIKPLLQHTDCVEYTLVELLYHVFHNMRRKFSNRAPEDLRNSLFTLIVTKKKAGKIAELRRLALERSIYFKIIFALEVDAQLYIDDMPEALATGKKTMRMREIERKYRAKDNPGFYYVCVNTLFWCKHAQTFREMIVEKFVRYAKVEARRVHSRTDLQISFADLWRNMIISIFKAIDKYDSDKGTLTSYIQTWFQDAQNSDDGHEEGVAYTIPIAVRKKLLAEGVVNIAAPIDEKAERSIEDKPSVLDQMADTEEMRVLQNLICRADSAKIFSLMNHISFMPNEDDQRRMQETLLSDLAPPTRSVFRFSRAYTQRAA